MNDFLTPNERDAQLRMDCLRLATAGQWMPDADVLKRAQYFYNFAMEKLKAADEEKRVSAEELNKARNNITYTEAMRP